MSWTMDKVREILMLVAAAMAVFSLIFAVYQAMTENLASAGVLSGIFLVCVLVVFLPRLEVSKHGELKPIWSVLSTRPMRLSQSCGSSQSLTQRASI
jgi:hypothetical protein